jgi:uncharacterized protein YutE (UPF0331/DUF86 family)
MGDIQEQISIEKEHIEKTIYALEDTLARDEMTIVELSAIATFVQNTYNGMENILKRVLKLKNIPIPHTGSSHKDLLELAKEKKIISEELLFDLDGYRAFRHFFVHGYGIMLDPDELLPLAEDLPSVWEQFDIEISNVMSKKKKVQGKGTNAKKK